jgi:hypothetical protein
MIANQPRYRGERLRIDSSQRRFRSGFGYLKRVDKFDNAWLFPVQFRGEYKPLSAASVADQASADDGVSDGFVQENYRERQ